MPATPPRALALILALAIGFAASEPRALARFAAPEDESSVIEDAGGKIAIRKDGTSTETYHIRVRILKDGARMSEGIRRVSYDPAVSRVKILRAETLNDGKRIPVPADQIEDKPLASDGEGFDLTNQITVAYPDVRIGSEVLLEYERDTFKNPIPGVVDDEFQPGRYQYIKHAEHWIESELPLYVRVQDPEHHLEVDRRDEGGKHILHFKLRKESHFNPLDETDASLNPSIGPRLRYSTVASWKELAARVAPKYEKTLQEKLPASYARIVEKARKAKDPVSRMNIVTSLLADEIRYLGDWRAVDGGHFPHSLARIARVRSGDCKDFATSTAAMLRALGYRATVAWVNRGEKPLRGTDDFPLDSFNHAIVRAWADGKSYWVDPTNRASFAQGIFEDILGRPALVLSDKDGGLEEIPTGSPDDSLSKSDSEIELGPGNQGRIDARISLQGRMATYLAGAALELPAASIEQILVKSLADETQLVSWKFGGLKLDNRIVEDQDFRLTMTQRNLTTDSSAGQAYVMKRIPTLKKLLYPAQDRVTDVFLGPPGKSLSRSLFRHRHLVGSPPADCRVDSPWVEVLRRVRETPDGVATEEDVTLKSAWLTAAEMKGREYAKFVSGVDACLQDFALVFQPGGKAP